MLRRTPLRVPVADPLRAALPALFPGDPTLIAGVRNVTTPGLDDRMYRMTGETAVEEVLPTDPYGFDTESIARDGSLWVSDEYRPSLVRFDAAGVMRQRIVPAGSGALPTDGGATTLGSFYDDAGEPRLQELLPAEYKGRRSNRGLEGLALSADSTKLYGLTQNALDPRAYPALTYGGATCLGSSDGNSDVANFFRNVRIVEFDITQPSAPVLTGEWLYRTQTISTTDSSAQGKLRISDITWAGPRRLVVAEHDDDAAAKANRALFEVDLNAPATNLRLAGPNDEEAERQAPATAAGKAQAHLGGFFDNGSEAELTALGITPAPGG